LGIGKGGRRQALGIGEEGVAGATGVEAGSAARFGGEEGGASGWGRALGWGEREAGPKGRLSFVPRTGRAITHGEQVGKVRRRGKLRK